MAGQLKLTKSKNNKYSLKMKYSFIILIISAIMLSSCTHDPNDPGRAYFPDMAYSVPYDAYTTNPVFPDGRTMQTPIEGTVPREMIPYQYKKTYDDQLKAGLELVNPMEANAGNIDKGKAEYFIFCSNCHGMSGKGDGHLYTSKLFTAKPTDLTGDYIQDKPDGELYHIITLGSLSGLMGAHGGQIKPDDRWKIITYVKNKF